MFRKFIEKDYCSEAPNQYILDAYVEHVSINIKQMIEYLINYQIEFEKSMETFRFTLLKKERKKLLHENIGYLDLKEYVKQIICFICSNNNYEEIILNSENDNKVMILFDNILEHSEKAININDLLIFKIVKFDMLCQYLRHINENIVEILI